jgi:hypothetical protein
MVPHRCNSSVLNREHHYMKTRPNQPSKVANIAVVTNTSSRWFPSRTIISIAKSKTHYDIIGLVTLTKCIDEGRDI